MLRTGERAEISGGAIMAGQGTKAGRRLTMLYVREKGFELWLKWNVW